MSMQQPVNGVPVIGAGAAGALAYTSGPTWMVIAGLVLFAFALCYIGALVLRLSRKKRHLLPGGAHKEGVQTPPARRSRHV